MKLYKVLFFLVTLLSGGSTWSCLQYQMTFLEALRSAVVEEGIKITEIDNEINRQVRERAILLEKLEYIPLALNGKIETQKYLSGLNGESKSAGIALTMDLGYWKTKEQNNVNKKNIEILSKVTLQQQQIKRLTIYEAIIEYNAAKKLESLFSQRAQLLEEQISYYEIEQKNGITRNKERLDVEFKIAELINKKLAARISLNKIKTKLELNSITELPKLDMFNESIVLRREACAEEALQEKIDGLDLERIQHEITLQKYKSGVQVAASTNYLSMDDGGSTTALAVNISVPLYSGGAKQIEDITHHTMLTNAYEKIDQTRAKSQSASQERMDLDELMFESISLLERQLTEGESQLTELLERNKLGQSTFIDIIERTVELNSQTEALIRLKKELYQGIVSYLGVMGRL